MTDTNEEVELESLGQAPNILKAQQSSRLLEKDCYIIRSESFTPEAVRSLIGCFLLQMIPGCQLALGSLIVYIVSYYKKGLEYEGVNGDTFYPILPMSIIYATSLFPVSNKMIDYF